MLIEKPPFRFEDFKAVMACWFPCEHEKREYRSWLTANKQWRIYEQCVDCGKLFRRGISFSAILPRLPKQLPPCDFEAARLFEQSYYGTSGRLAAHYNRYRKTSWWTQYSAYLRSAEWRARSQAAIAAANGVCTYCRERPAVQAHHISYARVGHELLEDLRAICIPCHILQHQESSPSTTQT